MKRILEIPQFRNIKFFSKNLEYEKNSRNFNCIILWIGKDHKTIHVKKWKEISEQIEKDKKVKTF